METQRNGSTFLIWFCLVCWRRYLRLKQRQEKPNSEKMETQTNGSTFLIWWELIVSKDVLDHSEWYLPIYLYNDFSIGEYFKGYLAKHYQQATSPPFSILNPGYATKWMPHELSMKIRIKPKRIEPKPNIEYIDTVSAKPEPKPRVNQNSAV